MSAAKINFTEVDVHYLKELICEVRSCPQQLVRLLSCSVAGRAARTTGSCNVRKRVVASSEFYEVIEKCSRSDVTIVKEKKKRGKRASTREKVAARMEKRSN